MRPYYYTVLWVELLDPWTRCHYPEIRLQSRCILGRLSSACASVVPKNSPCLESNEEDMLILMSLLNSAVHSPTLMVLEFDMEFSAKELILCLQSMSLNPKNLTRILSTEISSLLVGFLKKTDAAGKLVVCKLIWNLMDLSKVHHLESLLIQEVSALESDEDSDLQILSKGVRIALVLRTESSDEAEIGKYETLINFFLYYC